MSSEQSVRKQECPVCLDTYTKTVRKEIQCSYCNKSVCMSCMQQYLIQDTTRENICIHCKTLLSYDFIMTNFTTAFRNGKLKKHREKVLLDEETAKLPYTQDDAVAYIAAKEFVAPIDENIAILRNEMKNGEAYIKFYETKGAFIAEYKRRMKDNNSFINSNEYKTYLDTLDKLNVDMVNETAECRNKIRRLQENTWRHRAIIRRYGIDIHKETVNKVERIFIRKCPSESCEGYLSKSLECGMCSIKLCMLCHQTNNTDHVCDPCNVETVKDIKKHVKDCPKCGIPIYKINGCDQMWCTQCHTSFSWRKGVIENGYVHNPHYFAWMRETGQIIERAPGDNGCNVLAQIQSHIAQINRYPQKLRDTFIYSLWLIDHCMHRRNEHNQRATQFISEDTKRILRVQKLAHEITQDEWKYSLQRNEKAYHKEITYVHLYEMLTNALTDILSLLLEPDSNPYAIIQQIDNLLLFFGNEALRVSKQYKTVAIELPKDYPHMLI